VSKFSEIDSRLTRKIDPGGPTLLITRLLLATAAVVVALDATASAQPMVSASIGNVFGGDAPSSKRSWAVAIGGGGAHGIGSELEFAQTNDFFETADGVAYGKITTLMPSIFVAVPIAQVRPYGTFGFGFIRVRTESTSGGLFSNITEDDFGYSVGGGVMFQFARRAGVRVDLRRFKVRASDGVGFNRLLFGIVLGG
jgi:opacity protein-like surface antigen